MDRLQLFHEFAGRHPGLQISYGITAWDREDDTPTALYQDEFLWAWDRKQFEENLGAYIKKRLEIEALGRAVTTTKTFPNGLCGKVLFVPSGVRFYPEPSSQEPRWTAYIVDTVQV